MIEAYSINARAPLSPIGECPVDLSKLIRAAAPDRWKVGKYVIRNVDPILRPSPSLAGTMPAPKVQSEYRIRDLRFDLSESEMADPILVRAWAVQTERAALDAWIEANEQLMPGCSNLPACGLALPSVAILTVREGFRKVLHAQREQTAAELATLAYHIGAFML